MSKVKIGGVQDSPSPDNGTVSNLGESKPRAKTATSQQKELAAIMHAGGRDEQHIMDQLGLNRNQLTRMKKSAEWQAVAQGYREKHATIEAHHKLRMQELADVSYVALADLIREGDGKVQLEAIKYVQEQAGVSQSPQKQKVDVNLGFQQNNIEVTNNVSALLEDLKEVFPVALHQDDSRHVREGDEALPQHVLSQVSDAERRAEVVEAEFTGEPSAEADEEPGPE